MPSRKKVLIIDDSPQLSTLIKLNLQLGGKYEAVTGDDLASVESLCRSLSPDLIVMDFFMEGRSGAEVVAALKSDPALKRIPIILMSGYAQEKIRETLPETHQEGLFEHIAGYIQKPFETQDLLNLIDEILKKEAGP